VSSRIYVEGGGDSKYVDTACREGFTKLFEKCRFGTQKRKPRTIPCGSRKNAFDRFKAAYKKNTSRDFIALLIDSEEPLENLEAAWKHLRVGGPCHECGTCQKPEGATDEQALFMTTCMETWIVADRQTLQAHFKKDFHDSALPPLQDLETRSRHDVQEKLSHATRNCSNAYEKGSRSFEILGKLNPDELKKHLPSFARILRILNAHL
jgi:Domain of unknown function (DUF4276)